MRKPLPHPPSLTCHLCNFPCSWKRALYFQQGNNWHFNYNGFCLCNCESRGSWVWRPWKLQWHEKKTKENVFNHRDPIILYSSLSAFPSARDPPVNKVLRPFPHSWDCIIKLSVVRIYSKWQLTKEGAGRDQFFPPLAMVTKEMMWLYHFSFTGQNDKNSVIICPW